MQRLYLRSKIHRARVTESDLHYMGSITIDKDLLEAADIAPNEKILAVNLENGERFESYVFEGAAGSGVIGVNGAAARLVQPGDRLLIMTFAAMTDAEAKDHVPRVIFCDERNAVEGDRATSPKARR
jgi:aspartate 1-decarboxylase